MLVLDGTHRPGRVWVAHLTLSIALVLGLCAIGISALILLSCQHPHLSWLYFLRIQENASSNQARFGYLGVCTLSMNKTTCYYVDFVATKTQPSKFLSNNALTAERRLQPIFTPLLLISMILTSVSTVLMTIYRVGPMLLPEKVGAAIRSQKAICAITILVSAWLSYLLAWMAAAIIQQVTTVLSIIAGSNFDDSTAQYTFSSGTIALALQWALAGLVTLYAMAVTVNLLGLGTIRTETEIETVTVDTEKRSPPGEWVDVQRPWVGVVGRTRGARGSVMYWI